MRRSSRRYTGTKPVSPENGVRGCNAKRCYADFGTARRIAETARRATEQPLQPYRCHACGWWHIGGSERDGAPRRRQMRENQVEEDVEE
jgi:hypothetical protein